MVYRCKIRASEVVPFGLYFHYSDEVFLGHSGIASIVVHLVESSGEHDRSVIALGCTESGLDDCRRVRAYGKKGHRFVALCGKSLDSVQYLSQFRFHILIFIDLDSAYYSGDGASD